MSVFTMQGANNGGDCAIMCHGYTGSNPAVSAVLSAMFAPDLPSLNFAKADEVAVQAGGGAKSGGIQLG
jgi:hypothetical protein